MAGIYRITADRFCWCGAPAALIVQNRHNKKTIEDVCSISHGQMTIERIERQKEEDDDSSQD